jgi:cation diffusion facilitator CzcD-associated flavoprotein CzcO
MSFLHALECHKKMLETIGDSEALLRLPLVTCFEKADKPGGVWRANKVVEAPNLSGDVRIPSEKFSNPADSSTEPFSGHWGNDDEFTVDLPKPGASTDMYEALWTNGPKEPMEFFDYTFDDHFGHPLPVYMPRQPLLEYITARVTRTCPDFFGRVRFGKPVVSVKFNGTLQQFEVISEDTRTNERASASPKVNVQHASQRRVSWINDALVEHGKLS